MIDRGRAVRRSVVSNIRPGWLRNFFYPYYVAEVFIVVVGGTSLGVLASAQVHWAHMEVVDLLVDVGAGDLARSRWGHFGGALSERHLF